MQNVLEILSVAVEFLVGLICLVMADKTIRSKKFLPFHEQAYGGSWDTINPQLQSVILTILKISGLGFLVVGLMLMIFPTVSYLLAVPFIRYEVPALGFIYSVGLYLFNYKLFQKTNAASPWKASLVSAALLLVGIILAGISDILYL